MEGIIRTLKEHEASQPPEKEFRNIGEHGFDIEKHGSKLLQPMKEALEDPKRVRLFDILPPRSGLDKTGLGASSMQGVGSASSSFVKGASLLDEQTTQVEVGQSSTSKGHASPPHAYPEWAQLHTPPHSPLRAEGIDAFQNIEHLIQKADHAPKQLFHKKFPLQLILEESEVEEQVKHLKDLFGDEDAEDRERYISELKAQYGEKWKFTSDPFLLHIRLKKIAPIPYTEWPHKSHRFQVYPYMSDEVRSHGTGDSKAR